ncbi:hypothetical protein G6F50_016347 [Rhizopus delemar]|uniref:Uncharacterized protein n=1 Tax=Rhizopus delemar TaxID=936053 RepID=A0A9P6XTB0_9FUNG|nr:hypothetical protein G6F50_016347 [Rhizopus delemar]
MRQHRLRNDAAHAPARIQAGIGILENHLQTLAQGAPAGLRHARQGLPVKADIAARQPIQAHQHAGDRGFSAARFAHQRHRFTAANGEVQRLHRAVRFGAGAELHAQAFNRQ